MGMTHHCWLQCCQHPTSARGQLPPCNDLCRQLSLPTLALCKGQRVWRHSSCRLFALLCGGGNRRHWHCSQCVIGCSHRCSQSSDLLPLLLCPCSGGRHHGGEGRGHDDDLDPFFVWWFPRTIYKMAWTIMPTSFLRLTFGIANNDNTKDRQKREGGGGQWRFSTSH